jgi:hypothetical protein
MQLQYLALTLNLLETSFLPLLHVWTQASLHIREFVPGSGDIIEELKTKVQKV